MAYERFLSPGKIGGLELKNRSIFPPMGSGHVETDGTVGQKLIDYHVRRVLGGCAMNIVEIAAVHKSTWALGNLAIFDDSFIPGLAQLAGAIKEGGGKACLQIWHGGRQHKPAEGPPWGPSAIPSPLTCEMPHAMTLGEIKEVISSYGDAALRAKKAGFDAIEIHGAHGYLIDSFLNSYSNTRDDEYGGSLENRARFGCEVIADVRKKVGQDYPILFRMSAKENVEGGIVLEDAVVAAKLYRAQGVDAFDVSQGCYGAMPYTVPPYYYPLGLNVENAAEIKKNTDVPMIVAGRIISPDMAEKILEEDKADFISLGRIQLADPDFVKKTMEGRSDEIVRCISCNQGCVERMFAGLGVSCIFNPATGNEAEVVITPAKEKKKVLVIGGGPAGLEAARVAKERGHDVVLFEKSVKLGGQFLIAGFAPHKSVFAESAIHLGHRAQREGVDIHLYTEATEDRIVAVDPDVIVVATGSNPIIPEIAGVDGPNVYEARKVIGMEQFISEKEIVIIGGGLVGLEAAEILTSQGKNVTIVEMLDEVGKDLEMYIRPYAMEFLAKHEIPLHTKSKCVEIREGEVLIRGEATEEVLGCEAVILAVGSESNTEVVDIVKDLGYTYHVIGDAHRPAKVIDALWSGNEIAREI